jgi:hypothetical protein
LRIQWVCQFFASPHPKCEALSVRQARFGLVSVIISASGRLIRGRPEAGSRLRYHAPEAPFSPPERLRVFFRSARKSRCRSLSHLRRPVRLDESKPSPENSSISAGSRNWLTSALVTNRIRILFLQLTNNSSLFITYCRNKKLFILFKFPKKRLKPVRITYKAAAYTQSE